MLSHIRAFAARYPSWSYVAPFAVFLFFLAVGPRTGLGMEIHYPLRVLATLAALLTWSRKLLAVRFTRPAASLLLGAAVFLIWIAPDLLFPGYRAHWLFQNALTGPLASSLSEANRSDPVFLFWRALGLVVLVPVVEELFWRGWLMRYLISIRFQDVPLGAYAPGAFWVTAALFAAEHGPFWDVGLLAGVAYNAWMIRTRSLGDCILAHLATNACLGGYVLITGRWEYLL